MVHVGTDRVSPDCNQAADASDTQRLAGVHTHSLGGAASIGGDIVTGGGDFTGRDRVISGDNVSGDKVAGDKVDGLLLKFSEKLLPEEIAQIQRAMEERDEIWAGLVDQLLTDSQLTFPREPIICTQAVIVGDNVSATIESDQPLQLFRAAIRTHYRHRTGDIDRLLTFVEALSQNPDIPSLDSGRLRIWIDTATRLLLIDAEHIRQAGQRIAQQAQQYRRIHASMLITLRPRPGYDDQYQLWVSLKRPRIGEHQLLDDDVSGYTMLEIKQRLSDLRKQLPPWIRSSSGGGLVVEFLLPFELLCQLGCSDGTWQLSTWSCEEYVPKPFNKWVSKPLGELHPVIVRFVDWELGNNEPWEDRSRMLAQWLANPEQTVTPQLAYPSEPHPHYRSPSDWGYEKQLVGVVADTLVDSELDEDHWLIQMLVAGLPVGVWPTAVTDHTRLAAYLNDIFDAMDDRLPALVQEIWQLRRKKDMIAINMAVFWNDFERMPSNAALKAPR